MKTILNLTVLPLEINFSKLPIVILNYHKLCEVRFEIILEKPFMIKKTEEFKSVFKLLILFLDQLK